MNTLVVSPIRCCKLEKCVFDDHAICRVLGPEAAAEFDHYSHLHNYERGQTITGQDEKSVLVGNVVSGIVKLTVSSEEGKQQIVGLLYPSDFFGRVFSDQTRFSYEAATDVALCAIDRAHFERLLSKHPEVEHQLLINTLDELDAARGWISLINSRTTMQRVATFLYILMNRWPATIPPGHSGAGHELIKLPIGRRDIADFLGTTPETLSRNIQSLFRQKIIKVINPDLFELLDEDRLLDRAGDFRHDIERLTGMTKRPVVTPANFDREMTEALKLVS